MTRCSEGASDEPLAGTAPRARWWWLIEVAGSWGRNAVAECRVPAVRDLPSDEHRRVILVRRPGKHPAAQSGGPLRVWIAGALPGDPHPRLAVADAPEEILGWPIEGPPGAHVDPEAPALAVCTNSSRDLCCGLDGRALVASLSGSSGVWECSHLGGHRFAPTALHVATGLVYGRLTEPAARSLLEEGPSPRTAAWLRGRSSLDSPAQVADIHLMQRGLSLDPSGPDVQLAEDDAVVTFTGAPPVRLHRISGITRPEQCGGEATPAHSWIVTAEEVAP